MYSHLFSPQMKKIEEIFGHYANLRYLCTRIQEGRYEPARLHQLMAG